MLSVVKLKNGKYCTLRTLNNRRRWLPMQTQPETQNVISMRSYYTTLKSDSRYRKRVSWIVCEPSVALYEYLGTQPLVNKEHGSARYTDVEYVRTRPTTLDKIKTGLKERTAKPRQVYETLTLRNDCDDRPRDHKQVRNQAQVVNRGKSTSMNIADDIQAVLGGVHTHPFVKVVSVRHSRSPVIVAYTEEQVKDIKRFCSRNTPDYMRSVLGVDRTFNLGPCFATISVYKNMSVIRKTTDDNPIFLGPVMFNFDGRADTYKLFFRTVSDALAGDVMCAEVNGDVELVFGSDEEKAMVSVMKEVFPGVQHLFCTRHVEENVRRYMTDVVGVAAVDRQEVLAHVRAACTAKDTVTSETCLTDLMRCVRRAATKTSMPDKLTSYFNDRILSKIRNNVQVMQNNKWVMSRWSNNNAESINHVLKLKADWRQLPISGIIENVYDMVKLQYIDLKAALTGKGNFTLVPTMSRHVVPNHVWSTVSAGSWTPVSWRRSGVPCGHHV